MPAIPTPPPDASGGILVLQYTTPADTHRLRIHVAPFNYGGGGINFAYNPVVGSGAEVNVEDTFNGLAAVIKPMVPTAGAITLLSVYQIQSGVPVELFGWGVPAAVAGTYGGAAPTDQNRAEQTNYNFRSNKGGRGRIAIEGGLATGAVTLPATITASSGGSSLEQAIVAYAAGANSAVRCHDGSDFNPTCRRTSTLNKRLRRKYGFT